MQEKRYILLNHPNGCRDSYIKPGSSKKFTVEIPSYEGRKQHFLRVIGESDVCWQWRKESGNPYILAESIEDALYKDDIPDENYSLRIHANGEKFERNAYILLKKEMMECTASIRNRNNAAAISQLLNPFSISSL